MGETQALTLFKNLVRSTYTSIKKRRPLAIPNHHTIETKYEVEILRAKVARYHFLTHWHDRTIVHPLFAYSQLTVHHFTLVNHELFPFSPYGLLHKRECVWCHRPFIVGESLKAQSWIGEFKILEHGVEFDVHTELYDSKGLAWSSVTTVFKKLSERRKARPPMEANIANSSRKSEILVEKSIGLDYGLLSYNIDPIHISNTLAKLQDFPSAIAHGMWVAARALSERPTFLYPLKIEIKFLSSVPIPAVLETLTVSSDDGQSVEIQVLHKKNNKSVMMLELREGFTNE